MEKIFITGFLRSGTTLLEKILHYQPNFCIGSQPFPFLYYEAKRQFLKASNLPVPKYPLNSLFLEQAYNSSDFTSFLKSYIFEASFVTQVIKSMQDYSGQGTPGLLNFDLNLKSDCFTGIFDQLASCLPNLLNKPYAYWQGTKEVYCEEFIPLFLDSGIRTILIIRDPRDIIASIHGPSGNQYANSNLTVLYIVRQWRKSIAYALAYHKHPLFMAIRYEDLVQAHKDTCSKLATFLKTSFETSYLLQGLTDQTGEAWQGNSSFMPHFSISDASVGRYSQILSENTVHFINTVCEPEFKIFNYLDSSYLKRSPEPVIREFREPYLPGSPFLSSIDCHNELQRLSYIHEPKKLSFEEENTWFIAQGAFQELVKNT